MKSKIKTGDIFYFVDINLGKIKKSKLTHIKLNEGMKDGSYDFFTFSDFSSKICRCDIERFINPVSENYFSSYSKFGNSKKEYLVFTEVEAAQKALIDYVIPKMLELEQFRGANLLEQYQKVMDRVGKIEQIKKSNTDNFEKKCNALKNKFV